MNHYSRIDEIVDLISETSFENTFNPYFDRCNVFDTEDSPRLRQTILRDLLKAANDKELGSLWVGRDLGHRGGRRTGLALTDDVHFDDHLERWSLKSARPSIGQPMKERTASAIWDILSRIEETVFLWNVFPFHPYPPGNSFKNRTHNAREREFGLKILKQIIAILRPKKIVTLGRDAEIAVRMLDVNISIFNCRHPSFGGHNVFEKQVQQLYKLDVAIEQESFLDQFGKIIAPD